MADKNKIEVEIVASAKGLTAGLDKASAATADAAGKMKAHFSGLKNALSALKSPLVALGTAMGGAAFFRSSIDATQKWALEIDVLSRAMETSTESASVWAIAISGSNIEASQMINIMQRLKGQVISAEKEFKKYGVTVRDSSGGLLTNEQVLKNTIARYSEMASTTEKNAMLQRTFGRSWLDVQKLMNQTADAIAAAKAETEGLGLVIGPDGVAKAQAYKNAMDSMGNIFLGLQNAVGKAVMPAIRRFNEYMVGNGGEVMAAVGASIKTVITVFHLLQAVITQTINVWGTLVLSLTDGIGTMVAVVSRVLKGDFTGAWNQAKAGAESFTSTIRGGLTTARDEAVATAAAIKGVWAESKAGSKGGGAPSGMGGASAPKKEGAAQSQLPAFSAELDKRRALLAQFGGDLAKISLEGEKRYWSEVIGKTKEGSADWVAIRLKIAALGQAIEKDRIAKAKADSAELAAVEAVASEERLAVMESDRQALLSSLDKSLAAGKISAREKADAQIAAAREILEAQLAAIDAELSAREHSASETARLEAEKTKAVREHTQEVRDINAEATAAMGEQFGSFYDSMTSGFKSSIDGLIDGTMTWGDAFNSVIDSMLRGVIDFFVTMALEAIKAWAINAVVGATSRTAEAAGAAAVYSVNAMASVAAIPVYGWSMAPAVGAAAYAAGLSMAGLASAAGGWGEVPKDQIAQIHKKEMILPANLAEGVRDLIDSGGAKGEPAPTVNLTINGVIDGDKFMQRHQGSIVKAIGDAVRRGRR